MSRRAEVQLYSLEAEQVVLAGLMLANQTLSEVQDWLAPEDFWGADHAAIYAGIVALSVAGQPADGVTVGEWLHNQGGEDANHRASLAIDIAGSAYTAANVIPHAEIIASHSRRRRLADMLGRAHDAALHKREVSTEEIMSRVSALASELAPVNAGGLVPYRNYVTKFKDDLVARHRDGKPVGLPTHGQTSTRRSAGSGTARSTYLRRGQTWANQRSPFRFHDSTACATNIPPCSQWKWLAKVQLHVTCPRSGRSSWVGGWHGERVQCRGQ
ncbi:hypothetical protein SNK04_014207 [Fusarium graminearum]